MKEKKPLTKEEQKKKDDDAMRYFEDSILILGFLGGISLAALVLVLSEKANILDAKTILVFSADTYFQILTIVLATVSAICVMGCLTAQRAAAHIIEAGSRAWKFGYWMHNISFPAFLITLPMVMFPFAPMAAWVVVLVGVIFAVPTLLLPKKKSK